MCVSFNFFDKIFGSFWSLLTIRDMLIELEVPVIIFVTIEDISVACNAEAFTQGQNLIVVGSYRTWLFRLLRGSDLNFDA